MRKARSPAEHLSGFRQHPVWQLVFRHGSELAGKGLVQDGRHQRIQFPHSTGTQALQGIALGSQLVGLTKNLTLPVERWKRYLNCENLSSVQAWLCRTLTLRENALAASLMNVQNLRSELWLDNFLVQRQCHDVFRCEGSWDVLWHSTESSDRCANDGAKQIAEENFVSTKLGKLFWPHVPPALQGQTVHLHVTGPYCCDSLRHEFFVM